jgi:uncharacterized protein (DUF1778 family)
MNLALTDSDMVRVIKLKSGIGSAYDESVQIRVRAPLELRELIDHAAALVGQSRTEFMLESARRRAADVLLDQTVFALDEARHSGFMKILDQPRRSTAELRRLMNTKAAWDR